MMTGEVNLFLEQFYCWGYSLSGWFHRNFRKYPDGQIDLLPEQLLE
jgi:hypothetical protein